ncbi:PH domain-containing protein [Microbacterium sp. NPDC058342]|uniref:PH domain-containing protein n=1 Tax=Microbacterium sp. NPDC058342 TaxID=3346454 RepID=UPI0036527A87
MTKSVPASRTIRSNSGIVWLVVVAAIVAFLLGDLILRGTLDQLMRIAPWLLLIVWTVWALAVHPRVIADREGVEVINPLRTYRFGWGEVAELSLRWQIAFRLTGERIIAAWAVPVSRSSRARVSQPADREVEILQELREQAAAAVGQQLSVRWNVLPIAGFLLLLICGVVTSF